jgi:hypothetical protein
MIVVDNSPTFDLFEQAATMERYDAGRDTLR